MLPIGLAEDQTLHLGKASGQALAALHAHHQLPGLLRMPAHALGSIVAVVAQAGQHLGVPALSLGAQSHHEGPGSCAGCVLDLATTRACVSWLHASRLLCVDYGLQCQGAGQGCMREHVQGQGRCEALQSRPGAIHLHSLADDIHLPWQGQVCTAARGLPVEASRDLGQSTHLAPILHQAVTEALAEGGSLREQLLRGQECADLCQAVVGCLPHEAVGVQQGLEQEHMQLCIQLWGEGGAHGGDNELQRLQDTAL